MFWQSLNKCIYLRFRQCFVAAIDAAQDFVAPAVSFFVEPQLPEHVIEPDLPLNDKLTAKIFAAAFEHLSLLVGTDVSVVPSFLWVWFAELFFKLNRNCITQLIILPKRVNIR